MIYEATYEFRGTAKKFDIEAQSLSEAFEKSLLKHNTTLKIVETDRKPVGAKIFHNPVLFDTSSGLVEFLKSKSAEVHIRIHWGKSCELEARKFFRSQDIESVTDNIRPLDNEQYGLSGTVQFPEPPDSLLKELRSLDLNFHPVADGLLEVHSASFAITLVKAGLPADRSARFEDAV